MKIEIRHHHPEDGWSEPLPDDLDGTATLVVLLRTETGTDDLLAEVQGAFQEAHVVDSAAQQLLVDGEPVDADAVVAVAAWELSKVGSLTELGGKGEDLLTDLEMEIDGDAREGSLAVADSAVGFYGDKVRHGHAFVGSWARVAATYQLAFEDGEHKSEPVLVILAAEGAAWPEEADLKALAEQIEPPIRLVGVGTTARGFVVTTLSEVVTKDQELGPGTGRGAAGGAVGRGAPPVTAGGGAGGAAAAAAGMAGALLGSAAINEASAATVDKRPEDYDEDDEGAAESVSDEGAAAGAADEDEADTGGAAGAAGDEAADESSGDEADDDAGSAAGDAEAEAEAEIPEADAAADAAAETGEEGDEAAEEAGEADEDDAADDAGEDAGDDAGDEAADEAAEEAGDDAGDDAGEAADEAADAADEAATGDKGGDAAAAAAAGAEDEGDEDEDAGEEGAGDEDAGEADDDEGGAAADEGAADEGAEEAQDASEDASEEAAGDDAGDEDARRGDEGDDDDKARAGEDDEQADEDAGDEGDEAKDDAGEEAEQADDDEKAKEAKEEADDRRDMSEAFGPFGGDDEEEDAGDDKKARDKAEEDETPEEEEEEEKDEEDPVDEAMDEAKAAAAQAPPEAPPEIPELDLELLEPYQDMLEERKQEIMDAIDKHGTDLDALTVSLSMGGGGFRLPAARKMDMVLQLLPVHCHTVHPPGAPIPHPAKPYQLEQSLAEKVKIAFLPAACFGSQTNQCMLSGCAPGGPGMVILGSFKVFYGFKPAARMLASLTLHQSCLAPIPAPVGLVMTGWPLVMIG